MAGSIPADAKRQFGGSSFHLDEAANLDSIVVIRSMSLCHMTASLVENMQEPKTWKVHRLER